LRIENWKLRIKKVIKRINEKIRKKITERDVKYLTLEVMNVNKAPSTER
jgi:hypothetical protein